MKIFAADTNYADFSKVETLFFEYYRYLNSLNVPMKLIEGGEALWIENVKKYCIHRSR